VIVETSGFIYGMTGSGTLLFDNAARAGGVRLAFRDPRAEIRADTPAEVASALVAMDRAIAQGHWIAGYLAYELGYALEPRLTSIAPPRHGPLIRMRVFDRPQDGAATFETAEGGALEAANPEAHWPRYAAAFEQAHRYILDGDIYQVNLTFPLSVRTQGDPCAFYAAARARARAGGSALLDFGDEQILSFSPETFFTVRDGFIRTRPMKGTTARGPTFAEDLAAKRRLRADPKERAENLMIVDLLRNDLARIAEAGSVRVGDLFTVETFPRLHTMTSGVEARLRRGIQLSDVLRATFPCGSVTGAPKIRAMEIIRELEPGPRGVYCGAIGFAGPGVMAFNVAIRTLTIRDGAGVFPVGSGVVADSRARAEFEECVLKARFLEPAPPLPALLDTAAWRAGGRSLDWLHEARLRESAQYLGVPYAPLAAQAAMALAAERAGPVPLRMRLTIDADGGMTASAQAAPPAPAAAEWLYDIAARRVASGDWRQHHKTTDRAHYDQALAAARARGLDELVFLNERGEIVEGAISTIFLELDGRLVTAPLASGALDGVLRRALFEMGADVAERVVTIDDLTRADAVWFGNSVRGLIWGRRA
jgi:para-aminobenzoate synthetase/4-amino-4-deoxychorismate lyase